MRARVRHPRPPAPRRLRAATAAIAAVVLVPLAAGPALAAPSVSAGATRRPVEAAGGLTVPGPRPAPLPAGSRVIGAAPAEKPLELTVTVAPRDPAGLARFVAAVSDPTSPEYRHYLSPAQFAARFAPTAASLRALRARLARLGLRPGPVSPGGLSIPVTTTVAGATRALSARLETVRLADGSTGIDDLAAGRIPVGAQAVIGLDTLPVARPLLSRPAGTPTPIGSAAPGSSAAAPQLSGSWPGEVACPSATATASAYPAYTPNQLSRAYDLASLHASGHLGQGATIALVELATFDSADVATYERCLGADTAVRVESVDGGAVADPNYGSVEATLDIEDVIGLAPQASVVVYEAPNSLTGISDLYRQIVADDSAAVVSTSWGICEPDEPPGFATSEADLFEQAAAQGQTVFAAAGDRGELDCSSNSPNANVAAVDDPASQPDVTGVGGTDLTAIGPPPVETAWDDRYGAGGGGISAIWPMPTWQQGNSNSSPNPCQAASGSCREVPDVAASADPANGYVIYDQALGGWTAVGGTSAAAPLWAAATAVIDGGCPSRQRLGLLNPSLYPLGSTAAFHDITQEPASRPFPQYPVTAGYDMATGLGSPDVAVLADDLCPAVAVQGVSPGQVPVTGGTSLTVHGWDFTGVTGVTVGGRAAGYQVVSPTTLVVDVPAGTPGPAAVAVHASAGTSASVAADVVRYVQVVAAATDASTGGYWVTSTTGNVYGFDAPWRGSLAGRSLPAPVVGVAADGSTGGYWLVTAKGNVYGFDAPWRGSLAGRSLPAPVVGVAADGSTGGYWLVTAKGNLYGFDAPWYGSPAGSALPAPVVGIAATRSGYLALTEAGNVDAYHTAWYGSPAASIW
jgi:hypothetical protein